MVVPDGRLCLGLHAGPWKGVFRRTWLLCDFAGIILVRAVGGKERGASFGGGAVCHGKGNQSVPGAPPYRRLDADGAGERLATDIDINTVTSFCEMDYCSDNGLFYVTDAGNNLYEMDMSGNVKMLDQLGNGLDINGLAILPAAD